jgi:hypothetical protein
MIHGERERKREKEREREREREKDVPSLEDIYGCSWKKREKDKKKSGEKMH